MTFRLGVCAALFLLPVAAQNLQAVMLLFVPGIAACMLYGLPMSQGLAYTGAIFVTGSALAFGMGRPESALWLVQSGGAVILILSGLRQGRDGPEIFLHCVLYLCATTIGAFLAATGGNATEAYGKALESLSGELEKSMNLYASSAGQNGVSPEMTLLFQQVRETIIRFFPGIVMSSMVITACFNVLVCRRCLSAKVSGPVPISRFSLWKMPEWLIWPWIASGAVCFIHNSVYRMAGENILLAMSVIFLVAGISTAQFLLERFNVPRWIRWATWILAGLQWYGMLVLAASGIADIYVDFRKRFAAPEKGRN